MLPDGDPRARKYRGAGSDLSGLFLSRPGGLRCFPKNHGRCPPDRLGRMSEPQITEEQVLAALATVADPELGGDVVSRGMVRRVRACGEAVAFDLALPTPGSPHRAALEAACREAVLALPGVGGVTIRPLLEVAGAGGELLPGVRNIVAVGSGKGGVGKSTMAVNLAVSLALDGASVGLLDADVYGPSIPLMMGLRRPPEAEGGKLVPLRQHGVALMSLGFLMADDQAHVIWRGPMVASAVRQMLVDCNWGELDYLVVDLPPGTGDAQLTLAQSVPLTGAVVVMTSQDVAVSIAAKAVGMFQRLNVPILGVVGNMDSFACPHCGEHSPIFTRGGSEAAATRLGVPFLGSIPLDPATVEHGDHGTPTVLADPGSAQAAAFRAVARNTAAQVTRVVLAAPAENPLAGLTDRLGGR
jgi:ATP-binding protein involved in chromosome partitioning